MLCRKNVIKTCARNNRVISGGFMKLLFHKAGSRRFAASQQAKIFKTVYYKLFVIIRLKSIDT